MASEGPPPDLTGLENHYDQIQLMAIGGMAEVYRARQKSLDRPVAIKRIRPEYRANKDLNERFRREAKSSANLLHQNLAHVYDYLQAGEESFIVMEWIDGFDLAEIIERVGPLPVDVAVMIAVKTLSGLAYVHTHGMVHRDIKPDNIRISTRGDVKIMDFGIALDPGESGLTMPGTLIGSPHYLSPEQIKGMKVDHRADLFSFGITLYEILTGKRPFYETQKQTVYQRIQGGDFIRPTDIRPEIPAFLEKVVDQCLEVKVGRRPKGALQVGNTLRQYLLTHYSVDPDSRIRKFLVESGFLSGRSELIEVGEKTDPGAPTLAVIRAMRMGFWRVQKNFRSWFYRILILAVLVAVIAIFGRVVLNSLERKPGTEESSEVDQSPRGDVVDDRPTERSISPRKRKKN